MAASRETTDPQPVEGALRDAARRSDFLDCLGKVFTGGGEPTDMLRRCAQSAADYLDAPLACVWTRHWVRPVLDLAAQAGSLDASSGGVRAQLPADLVVADLAALADPAWTRDQALTAVVAHPLTVGERMVGLLAVFLREAPPPGAAEALLSAARTMAIGLECQRLGAARQRLADQRTDEQLQMLARAVECSSEMVSVTDVDDRFIFVNHAFLRTYGYTAAEVLGQTPALVVSPSIPPELPAEISRESRSRGWRGKLTNRRRNGSEFIIHLSTSPVRDAAGQVIGLLGVARDMTERLAAQEAVRTAEDRMRFALQASRVGVWEADLRTGMVYWSETCEAIHGMAPGTFARTYDAFLERIDPSDRARVKHALEQAARDHIDVALEYQTTWPDGTARYIGSVGRFFYDDADVPVRGAGVATDITERRSLEDQLRQAQKIEAIGQLAGGIAHDFNNLLTVISGYAQEFANSLGPEDARRDDVAQVLEAARQGSRLTRQLLAFGRKQILRPEVLDVNALVYKMGRMITRVLGEHIQLTFDLQADLARIRADPGQIEQVLLNLAVNAADAMPNGGRLTIGTAGLAVSPLSSERAVKLDPGLYVCLTVSDTGMGMDQETQEHIFEPFFTTKERGKGTGLGLATVFGIVKQSGGGISVHSEPGLGTTFSVYLPAAPASASAARAELGEVRGGTETVLVVEDEATVRALAARMLRAHGYTVLIAEDPGAAVTLATSPDTHIDLLLTDVVMPGMNGPALFARLRAIRPELKVLFTSGFTRQLLDPEAPFLPKPFTTADLARKVREALDVGAAVGRSSDPRP